MRPRVIEAGSAPRRNVNSLDGDHRSEILANPDMSAKLMLHDTLPPLLCADRLERWTLGEGI